MKINRRSLLEFLAASAVAKAAPVPAAEPIYQTSLPAQPGIRAFYSTVRLVYDGPMFRLIGPGGEFDVSSVADVPDGSDDDTYWVITVYNQMGGPYDIEIKLGADTRWGVGG